jgi:glucosamine--fructose-6-phosphate aminotransferase (isomerizing)
MCGIVGAIGSVNVAPILLEGLKRLEYRGYDSAGVAILDPSNHQIQRVRTQGKVAQLQEALWSHPIAGQVGIAHTRWATHGAPCESNAHPLLSASELAIVHNGIIENHEQFRPILLKKGYKFTSQTDTEVAAHLIHSYLAEHDLLTAVRLATQQLEGAYALAVISAKEPDHIIAVRNGPPLVVGLGEQSNFVASDTIALLQVTNQFIYLEDGDIVDIHRDQLNIFDAEGQAITRKVHTSQLDKNSVDKGNYRHYMLKEIFEQPLAIDNTLDGRITKDHVLEPTFGADAALCFDKIKRVQIAACGTSYHAGLVARYWMESVAGIPCQVEVASELRYRQAVISADTLFVVISQSGETADTLAALRQAKELGYSNTLAICNVPESSLVREADFTLLTRAGTEIGVASTKAFTTQLTALLLLTIVLGRRHKLTPAKEAQIVGQLRLLSKQMAEVLTLDDDIKHLAARFVDKQHTLFLGRGLQYAIALEGALKLKELSYIHAEAYPAGELKHGPLALVDKNMLVIAIAPNDALLEKLKSNLQEVHARGGMLVVFGDISASFKELGDITLLPMPAIDPVIAPIVYTLPLQLLAYHVAVLKGTDVDQPRNLAKSVTVE